MDKVQKAVIAFGVLTAALFTNYSNVFAQASCTNVPVEEAVINGDFETPYDFLSGPPPWFQLDGYWPNAEFSGIYDTINSVSCYCATLNMYWISTAFEDFRCDNTDYRDDYPVCPSSVSMSGDHTPGLGGAGHFLSVDTWSDDGGPGTRISTIGSEPIVWQQTVNIYPSQTYYFSTWVANWNSTSPAQLRFFVQWLDGGGAPVGAEIELGASPFSASGTDTWEQFYETTTSPAGAAQAVLTIRNQNVITNGNDFALDDISFINGCQSLSGSASFNPDFGSDSTTICVTNGSLTLDPGVALDGNRSFYWFEGTGTPQTALPGNPATDNTYTINEPGTYRVCIQDPDEACAISQTIVVTDELEVDLGPDADLCSPPTLTLDANVSGPSLNYTWTVPAGATDPGNSQTAIANVAGNYQVNVQGPSGAGPPAWNCQGTDDVDITSSLPVVPDTNNYCDGGGVTTSLGIDGVNSYNWFEDASGTTPLSNSTTPGVAINWTPPGGTTGDQTFYVVSNETSPVAGGNPFGPSGSAHNVAPVVTNFTAQTAIRFVSFQVFHPSWNGPCAGGATAGSASVFEVENLSTSQVYSVSQVLNCNGWTTITPNWDLPAGDYVLRAASNVGQLAYVSAYEGTPTLFSLPGVINISGYGSANYQGNFRNWNIQASQACDPVPVVVEAVTCCVQPTPGLSLTTGTNPFCAGDNFILTATPNGATAPVVYKWFKDGVEIPGETAATLNMTSISTSDAGDYTVAISSSGGCAGEGSQSSAVTITVNPTPATPTAGSNSPVCEGGTLNLTANTIASATYSWTGPNSFTSGAEDPTVSTNATLAMDGIYSVTATVSGCTSNAGTVDVTITPKPATPTAGSNSPVCEEGTLNLTANTVAGATYSWTGPNSFTSGAEDPTVSTNATSAMDGTYNVTVTVSGCTSDAGATSVTITPKPAAPTAGSNGPVCVGNQLDLTANTIAGATYSWTGPNSFTSGAEDPTVSASVSLAMDGIYSVTATVSGCTSNAGTVDVTINPNPSPTIGTDLTNMCENTTRTFSITNHTVSSTYAWTVTGTGVSDDGSTDQTIDVTAGTGNITISVIQTDANGCSNPSAVNENISVDRLPTPANIVDDTLKVCVADPIQLTGNNPSTGTGSWTYGPTTTGGTIDNTALYNSTVSGMTGGDILEAIWTISNGVCTASDDTLIVEAVGIADPAVSLTVNNTNICQGDSIAFEATPTNGGSAPLYEFYNANTGAVLQAQSGSNWYTIDPANTDTSVYVILTSNSSCVSGTNTAQSANVSVSVQTPPTSAVINESDFNTCSASEQLTNQPVSSGTGTWTIASGPGSVDATGLVTGLVAGQSTKVYFTTSSGGSCLDSRDSVTIDRLNVMTTPNAGTYGDVCESTGSITLSANAVNAGNGETGTWRIVNGPGSIASLNNPTATLTITGAGLIELEWIISNGICPNDTSATTIMVDTMPAVVEAGPADAVCTDQYTLNASTPDIGTGMWSGGTFDDAALTNATASGLVTGNNVFTWTVTNGTCSANDNVTINKSGTLTTANAGADDTVCTVTSYTLAGNAVAGGETGTWIVTAGGASVTGVNNPSSGVTGLTTGLNTFGWVISNGVCPNDTDYVNIVREVVPSAAGAITGTQPVCENTTETYSISAVSGATSYNWSTPSGTSITSGQGTTSITVSIGNTSGNITVTPVNSCGNGTTANLSITVTPLPVASGAITGPDTVCVNQTSVAYSIGAVTNATNYTWLVPSGASVASGQGTNSITVDFGSTSGTVMVIPDNTCGVTDTATIAVTALPNPSTGNTIQGPASICQGLTGTYSINGVSNATNFTWTLPAGWSLTSQTDNATGSSINVTVGTSGGIVSVDMSNMCAFITENLNVNVLTTPTPVINANDTSVCEGSALTLNATASGGGTLNWTLNGSPLTTGASVNISSASSFDEGIYVVTEDLGSCSGTSNTVEVTVETPPNVFTGPNVSISETENTQLSASGASNYLWTPATGLSNPNSPNPTASPDTTTTYTVTGWNSSAGCSSSDQVTVYVFPALFIYNSFTPNGDGLNDSWEIKNAQAFPNMRVKIFNRWGDLIFESTGYNQPWDGKMKNGGDAPVATYYYIIELNTGFDNDEPKTGSVTIVK